MKKHVFLILFLFLTSCTAAPSAPSSQTAESAGEITASEGAETTVSEDTPQITPAAEDMLYQSVGVIDLISDDGKTLYLSAKTGEPEIPSLLIENTMPDGFSVGDIVYVEFEKRILQLEDKTAEVYYLVSLSHSDEMFQDGYALSDYITFTPDHLEIREWIDTTEEGEPFSLENMKEVSSDTDDPDEIQKILSQMDDIHVYADGAVDHSIGVYPFTLIFTDKDNEIVFKEVGSVTVFKDGTETELFYKSDQDLYTLYKLFHQ